MKAVMATGEKKLFLAYLRVNAAFSNSDGDQQMLEWTGSHPGPRFMVVRLDKALAF